MRYNLVKPMHRCDYLVVSISAFSEINRKMYYLMAEMGQRVVLVFPEYLLFDSGRQRYEPVAEPDKITAIPSETVFDNPRLTYFKKLGETIKTHRPKYIYTEYDPGSLMGVLLGKYARKYDAKLMFNSCENLDQRPAAVLKREGIKGLLPALLKNIFVYLARPNTYHVFALGTDGAQIFKGLNFKSVSVNHLGFEETLFVPDETARNSIRSQLQLTGTVVAYFGRLIQPKGIHILIEALGQLNDLEWTFLIDEFSRYKNPYQQRLIELMEAQGIRDRVVFFDAPHEKVADYMNAADIVVVPSISSQKWKEQFGRVAPEAMACGKAVIVSDSGTLKELVPDETHVFPENNPTALAAKLRELIVNAAERERLAQRGKQKSVQYSIRQQAINLMSIQ